MQVIPEVQVQLLAYFAYLFVAALLVRGGARVREGQAEQAELPEQVEQVAMQALRAFRAMRGLITDPVEQAVSVADSADAAVHSPVLLPLTK